MAENKPNGLTVEIVGNKIMCQNASYLALAGHGRRAGVSGDHPNPVAVVGWVTSSWPSGGRGSVVAQLFGSGDDSRRLVQVEEVCGESEGVAQVGVGAGGVSVQGVDTPHVSPRRRRVGWPREDELVVVAVERRPVVVVVLHRNRKKMG